MNLETSHWILIATTISGYVFAISQYYLKRKHEKQSQTTERKFQVYSEVLRKFDELNKNLRINSVELLNSSAEVFDKLIFSKTQEEKDTAITEFNKKLNEQTTKAFQPLYILKNEQYSLKLLCSNKLKEKLDQYIMTAEKLFSNYGSLLSTLSIANAEKIKEKFEPMKEDNDLIEIQNLLDEIIKIMREEINIE